MFIFIHQRKVTENITNKILKKFIINPLLKWFTELLKFRKKPFSQTKTITKSKKKTDKKNIKEKKTIKLLEKNNSKIKSLLTAPLEKISPQRQNNVTRSWTWIKLGTPPKLL